MSDNCRRHLDRHEPHDWSVPGPQGMPAVFRCNGAPSPTETSVPSKRYQFSIVMGQLTETIVGDRNTVHLDSGWILIAEKEGLRMMGPGTVQRVEVIEIKTEEDHEDSG